jgi:hypothetical protein
MYIIWHDNDYDLAKWVYENSDLRDKAVILRAVPKSNNSELIIRKFTSKEDYHILPLIKLATPDIIIQKIDENGSKILFVSEFMTHTPQHDHVFQRFERIYCASKERIPVAFILAETKTKLEKGGRGRYKETKYSPNPLAVHTYLKTSLINDNPTLMFFWPNLNGYLKYDSKHQTAPKIEGDIIKWFKFLNEALTEKKPEDLLKKEVVKSQIDYLIKKYPLNKNNFYSVSYKEFISNFKSYYELERVNIMETKEVIKRFKLDQRNLPKGFIGKEKSLIFEYNSEKFRTDPYCGFICGYKNLFCINEENKKEINLIHIPKGINYKDINDGFDLDMENLSKCPIDSLNKINLNDVDAIKKHMKDCVYTKSKQKRIFGTIPDVIIFDDMVFYIKNE